MNNDAIIAGRLGQNMMGEAESPTDYDLKNYGVGSKIARTLFPDSFRPPGGGSKLGSDVPTEDILKAGQQAKEQRITDADAEDLANTVDELSPVTAPEEGVVPPTEGTLEPEMAQTAPEGVTGDPEIDAIPDEILKESPNIDPEEYNAKVEERKQQVLERRTWERNVNLDYIADAEDLGAYLDSNADYIAAADRESLASIEADVDGKATAQIMKEVLVEKPAALSSRQLLAGRRMLLTIVEEVKNLSEKIANGDDSSVTLLKFQKYQAQSIMLQEYMQGAVRETARALNSMKIVAQALNTRDLEAISAMSKSSGNSAWVQAKMMKEHMEMNPDVSAAQLVAESAKRSKAQESLAALINYWTASILTGFKTNVTNVVSTTAMGAINTLFVKPVAAGVGAARRRLLDAQNTTQWSEVGAEYIATREGFKSAIEMGSKLFTDGWNNKGEYTSQFGQQRLDELTRGTKGVAEITGLEKIPLVGGLIGLYERGVKAASYGALSAGDEFFKAMVYRKSIYGNAIRTAKNMGLKGDEAIAKANELIQNPNKAMHDEAIREAERQTFTNDPGGFLGQVANKVAGLAQDYPVLKFVVPFIRTPTALLNRSLIMSPLAPITKDFRERVAKGGPEADTAIAEMTVGTVFMSIAYMLYQEGAITGEGPENFDQRESLKRLGVQPNSIKKNGVMFTYDRGTDPLGAAIGAIATMMDRMAYSKDEANAGTWFATGALSMAAYFKEAPYMQGFSTVMRLIDDDLNFNQYAARQMASFIPALSRDMAKIYRGAAEQDPTQMYSPRSMSFWNTLQNEVASRVPGAGSDIPPKRYWDGSIVDGGGGVGLYLFNTVSPIQVTNMQDHPESVELAANGVNVPEPNPQLPLGNGMKIDILNDLENGEQLYDRMLKTVGETRAKYVGQVIKLRDYKKRMEAGEDGPGSENAEMLQTAITRGSREGKLMFLEELKKEGVTTEEYGEKAVLLNDRALDDLMKGLRRAELGEEQEDMLREAGAPGMPNRQRLYVPDM